MPPKRPSKANEEAPSRRNDEPKKSQEEERKVKIPPELIAKLVKNFLEDEGTKVSGAATKTVGEYMHLFLTEAVYRAVSNRRDGDPWAKTTNSGLMLEVCTRMSSHKICCVAARTMQALGREYDTM
ncbi:hypothetical protein AOL_s00097g586 [Orbilia oligospora ATCC 24927]|uniref:Uncharacterized protein n=1 Tax=Arthrobotrys oligospora (strain ATCC 24927 / CBS 115.81 / DSM 1491) TaxID=756982 RepID=G1XJQ9_ARTOA|nr:hypothetical protein AOL_s00097g586 [Orbilia oligospora ATCC 24927]EGX46682.1 hypothetical protein AOL_s00097g586 [Orbilia oligospora ATCC 24927]